MTVRATGFLQRAIQLLGLFALMTTLAARSGSARAQDAAASDPAEDEPAPPPPPPPPPPQLLDAGPTADSVKDKVSYEAPEEDALSLNLSAGGAFAFGNTQAYQVSAGGDFRWVGRPHSVSANVLWLMGGAKLPGTSSIETTSENVNGRLKYELFLTKLDSLFAGVGYRQDRFAGMKPRVNGQVGYGHYFVQEEKVRFWGEVGYDLMFTNYVALPGMAADFAGETAVVHSARVFAGLEHQLHEYLSYVGGIEGFINVEEPGASRLVSENALRSTLSDSFKLELKARFMYEAKPVVPGAKKLDTALVISLLYSVI